MPQTEDSQREEEGEEETNQRIYLHICYEVKALGGGEEVKGEKKGNIY